jgi:hypothetical protein
MRLWVWLKWRLRWIREVHDLWRERFIGVVLNVMLWFQHGRDE